MIEICVEMDNAGGENEVVLETNGMEHRLSVPAKPDGSGSRVNGGEMLFLALATCYCNDIYREAARKGIKVEGVQVRVEGAFGFEPGSIAENVVYHTTVEADANEEEILALIEHTDTVAEVHNTLRQSTPVRLGERVGKPVSGS